MNASLIALSGLQASATRLGVSASNVANANTAGATAKGAASRGGASSTAYRPLAVDQTTVPGYGVAANVTASGAPPQPVYAPESLLADSDGMIDLPDVDPVEEAMAQIRAVTAYRASLSVMRTSDEMDRALLDSRF